MVAACLGEGLVLEFGGLVCGGDSGVADGGVVGGHGLRVSKRLPGVFAGEPFRCRFSVWVFRACWLLVIPVPKPVSGGKELGHLLLYGNAPI